MALVRIRAEVCPRQRELLALLARGLTDAQAANELHISLRRFEPTCAGCIATTVLPTERKLSSRGFGPLRWRPIDEITASSIGPGLTPRPMLGGSFMPDHSRITHSRNQEETGEDQGA